MTAICFPCSRAPSATPASTGIKSPSIEIGDTTLRLSRSPKCDVVSRPPGGDPDVAMYYIMMSAGQVRIADRWTRYYVALWRSRQTQCGVADLDAWRFDSGACRRGAGGATARETDRGHDLHRRR